MRCAHRRCAGSRSGWAQSGCGSRALKTVAEATRPAASERVFYRWVPSASIDVRRHFPLLVAAALHAGVAIASAAHAAEREPDVNYIPTPQHVVDDMLRLVDLRPGDTLYDLGSGDGRIPITAARRYGIRAVGIDIDPVRIDEAEANAREQGVAHLVAFRQEDLFAADFSDATVVTLYLFPDLNLKLRPRLLATLKPGTRIVSHRFDMGNWQPDKTLTIGDTAVYFWTVPQPTTPAPRTPPADATGLP